MDKERIRLGNTDSTDSLNKVNLLDLQLEQDSNPLLMSEESDNVDIQEVFNNERDGCSRFRIALTIIPVFSNVIHNVQTEIVKNEGSDKIVDMDVVTDGKNAVVARDVYGTPNPTRIYMIKNTEFSRDEIGYKYHIGDDILNNHLLRKNSFSAVNLSTAEPAGADNKTKWRTDAGENEAGYKECFNTIGEYAKDSSGNYSKLAFRMTARNVGNDRFLHLYKKTQVQTISESMNSNRLDDKGWYGVKNIKNIDPLQVKTKDTLGISMLLNDHQPCEFIDFYPERGLYMFEPQLNKYRKRYEYNWDISVTYPFKNNYDHEIVSNATGTCNAIKIISVLKERTDSGTDVLVFRSSVRHNLAYGNKVQVYFSDKDGNQFTKLEDVMEISSVHGVDKNYSSDSYFFTTKMDILSEIFGKEVFDEDTGALNMSDNDINEELSNHQFRFTHVVNGKESEYYIRMFRKLPNMKYATDILTDEIAKDDTKFFDYIQNNASYDSKFPYEEAGKKYMYCFEKEEGSLSFSKNIFNDTNYQFIFQDTIDLSKIRDNRGRPLHEVFITFVKLNRGYRKWYIDKAYADPEVEFSHCFGKLTSGLSLSENEELDMGDRAVMRTLASLSDVKYINNFNLNGTKCLEGDDYELTSHGITKSGDGIQDNEWSGKDVFFGDVVEYNAAVAQETVLSDVYGRFNTAQRELKKADNDAYSNFTYDEIVSDDNDKAGFIVEQTVNKNNPIGGGLTCANRPEGNYYKMHWNAELKQFGTLQQASHTDIIVSSAEPYQSRGMYIMITTPYHYNGLFKGDRMYICDDGADKWYKTNIVGIVDETHFYISPITEINWVRTCNLLLEQDSDKRLRLRHNNESIPDYAERAGVNSFYWRNLMSYGDPNATDLSDLQLYNGHIYADKQIIFALKRQDPYGERGLATTSGTFPTDIVTIRPVNPSDNTYKEEDKTC